MEIFGYLQSFDYSNLSFSDIVLILLFVGEVITNLTPSEKDNSVFEKVKTMIRVVFKDVRKKDKEINKL